MYHLLRRLVRLVVAARRSIHLELANMRVDQAGMDNGSSNPEILGQA